jgi:hypothetical protein
MTLADKYNCQRRNRYATVVGRASQLWSSARKAARRKGLPFSITRKWIEEKLCGWCEVSGISFDMETKPYGTNPFSPSLDRTDSIKGYTPDNVKLVVWMYNAAKSANQHGDVMKLAKALVGNELSR